MIQFVIPINPVTKKNHGQIITGKNGRKFMLPSKQYKQYEKDIALLVPKGLEIDYKINIKAVYYMQTRRRVDLCNLHNALHDALVHYGVLEDDNSNIVHSTDGSYVDYDKHNPRTEVTITCKEELTCGKE